MPGTQHDVIIDGVKARIKRATEGGGYEERTVRAEISQQLISQQQNASIAQRSRPDGASMYQTNWAGGSRWWKPLLTGEEIDSYHTSVHMDLWTEPGKVLPGGHTTTVVGSGVNASRWFTVGNDLYAVNEAANSVEAAHHDIAIWTPGSSPNWAAVASVHSTLNVAASPLSLTYDASDGFIYIATSDGEVNRFNLAATMNSAWITGADLNNYGTRLFVHQGSVWVWNGITLSTINKAGPSLVVQFNDGLGEEAVGNGLFNTRGGRMVVPTPEGIYYVKNVRQEGSVLAYVFRIDRDASGAYIGQPVATLPNGVAAIGLTYHMGSLLIATVSDLRRVMGSAFTPETADVTHYYVTPESMGVLGVTKGGAGSASRSAWRYFWTDGPYVVIGGYQSLWVYDAIAGGLHLLHNSTPDSHQEFAAVETTSGQRAYMTSMSSDADGYILINIGTASTPDTVSAFGDDETYYTLESNYFDAGLPMENKQLNKVEILFDPGTQTNDIDNQEWTVQISADDGAFTDVITSADTGYDTLKGYAIGWADLTGRRFRYKLIYQTKTAVKLALRAIMATFVTGEMVREWHLTLDGTEFLNVDNEVITPRTFLDSMRTVIGDEDVVPFINNFEDVEQNVQTDATPVYVKVQQASIVKSEPGESTIRVVLREDPYHST